MQQVVVDVSVWVRFPQYSSDVVLEYMKNSLKSIGQSAELIL